MREMTTKPPEHLSERSKEVWRSLVGTRIKNESRILMLENALSALDRAEKAKEIIDQEGMLSISARSGLSHPHPLLKVEKENREIFIKSWLKMGLAREHAIPLK